MLAFHACVWHTSQLVTKKCGASYTLCPKNCDASGDCYQIPHNVHYEQRGWADLVAAYMAAVLRALPPPPSPAAGVVGARLTRGERLRVAPPVAPAGWAVRDRCDARRVGPPSPSPLGPAAESAARAAIAGALQFRCFSSKPRASPRNTWRGARQCEV